MRRPRLDGRSAMPGTGSGRSPHRPAGDLGEAAGERERTAGARHRPLVAQHLGDLPQAAAGHPVERLEEEGAGDHLPEHEPERIAPRQVGELMGEHPFLLLVGEAGEGPRRHADLGPAKAERHRHRHPRRAGEADGAAEPGLGGQLAELRVESSRPRCAGGCGAGCPSRRNERPNAASRTSAPEGPDAQDQGGGRGERPDRRRGAESADGRQGRGSRFCAHCMGFRRSGGDCPRRAGTIASVWAATWRRRRGPPASTGRRAAASRRRAGATRCRARPPGRASRPSPRPPPTTGRAASRPARRGPAAGCCAGDRSASRRLHCGRVISVPPRVHGTRSAPGAGRAPARRSHAPTTGG